MKLEEALAAAKTALTDPPCACDGHFDALVELVEAVEAHLREEEVKRNIYRQAFGLEPSRRHGGD